MWGGDKTPPHFHLLCKMSEREIRHFKYGREYIPTSLAGSDTCRLVILTDDQIEVLSNLVNYAHDRRNWNDETIDSERYYMPSDDDWDNLESLVDNLEYQLMSDLDPVDGDLILGNVTPEWSKLAVSIPGANLINVLAVASADLRPSWKTASSNPGATASILASTAAGILTLVALRIGAGATATASLDVSASVLVMGADNNLQTRTNGVVKTGKFQCPHYNQSTVNPFLLFAAQSNDANNVVQFGGGTTGKTCATVIQFFTHTNHTDSTAGVEALRIDNAQNVGIGTTAPKAKLHVVGLSSYASNAAAIAGGLTAGAFYYETGTDPARLCVVT